MIIQSEGETFYREIEKRNKKSKQPNQYVSNTGILEEHLYNSNEDNEEACKVMKENTRIEYVEQQCVEFEMSEVRQIFSKTKF